MKPIAILSAVAAMLLAGCIYEVPLVAEHTIPIDPALVGLWEAVPKEPAEPEKEPGHPLEKVIEYPKDDARLLILKFSETEYVVTNPAGEGGIHYRAYAIELGGKRCMQLQVIGTSEGPPDWEDDTPRPYGVCSFEIKDGNLVVRTLSEELVGDLKTTAEMQEAFLKNKDNPGLFGDPTVYRKVKAE